MNNFDEEKENLAAEENVKYVEFLKWLAENKQCLTLGYEDKEEDENN